MKIALVQTNPVIGAFERNFRQVAAWIEQAKRAGCGLAVFPELTLCGYPPLDLLERSAFIEAHDRVLADLIKGLDGITCIVGAPERRQGPGKPLYNTAYVIERGAIVCRARKQRLSACEVFDEGRCFEPGDPAAVFSLQGLRYGLTIREDSWWGDAMHPADPLAGLAVGPVVPDCLINIAASPYYYGKVQARRQVYSQVCRHNNLPLLYVNQVGGQDGLIFDGHSLAMSPNGALYQQTTAAGFTEDMLVVDSEAWYGTQHPGEQVEDSIADVEAALVLGVRDYLRKTGHAKAVLGLSGGIDSALTAVIGCRALGPENVLCVTMPSPYTAQQSIDDSRQLAENLGCDFAVIDIAAAMEVYRTALAPLFAGQAKDVTEQNLQARIRGNLLMALANQDRRLLLSTGNKSEMAVGYCTLYGDMSGALAVIADVPKGMVYALARSINQQQKIIPERTILRPPTAELKPNQFDQDDLPPYDLLDTILHAYLDENKNIAEIAAGGVDVGLVRDIVRRVHLNAYKRKQAAVGLRVTSRTYGPGSRYPLVHGFVE